MDLLPTILLSLGSGMIACGLYSHITEQNPTNKCINKCAHVYDVKLTPELRDVYMNCILKCTGKNPNVSLSSVKVD